MCACAVTLTAGQLISSYDNVITLSYNPQRHAGNVQDGTAGQPPRFRKWCMSESIPLFILPCKFRLLFVNQRQAGQPARAYMLERA